MGPFLHVFVAFVSGATVARQEFELSVKVVSVLSVLCAALGPALNDYFISVSFGFALCR